MPSATDKHFIDWESYVFGYGYGSGEAHVIGALVKFFESSDGLGARVPQPILIVLTP